MLKTLILAVIVFCIGLPAIKSSAAIGDFPWNYSNSNIYFNSGNVGIGVSNPVDMLTINTKNTGISTLSDAGKIYIGEGTGSWWFAAKRGTDGRGYNNIASNGYSDNGWFRRELNKETWVLSNFTTENNGGYFRIFHAAPQNSYNITNLKPLFSIDSLGNTEINGSLRTKQITVTSSGWADYVFDNNYSLISLSDLETYIKQYGHLPNIPNQDEIENSGIDVSKISKLQMEKIEELTLYSIQLEKDIKNIKEENTQLKQKNSELEERIERLEKLLQ